MTDVVRIRSGWRVTEGARLVLWDGRRLRCWSRSMEAGIGRSGLGIIRSRVWWLHLEESKK